MANLRVLGLAATMALGAAGLSSCIWDCRSMGCDGNHSGHKTEQRPTNNVQTNPQPAEKPKSNEPVMPPLTLYEGGDTLIFNSKQDSTEYRKYDRIAFDNFSRISGRDYEISDSLIKAAGNEADSIKEAERKEWEPKYDAIQEKYKNDSDKLEQQYKDGKITFAKLESEKKALETKKDNETSKLFSKYTKGDYAQRAYDGLQYLESKRHEEVDSKAYAQYEKDREDMRKKYCKEVRPYVPAAAPTKKLDYAKGMEIDGVKVKWKSEQDSIAVSNYINAQVEREEKANSKIREQQEKLEQQISEIEAQEQQVEYEAAVLYKQGKTKAAINKEAQLEKLNNRIEKLEDQISALEEKCQYEEISIDTINKHAVQNFDKKNIKTMKWNF